MWRDYIDLTKPRMVAGNLLPAVAAYIFAAQPFEASVFFCLLIGLAFVIGGACVFNNIYDRELDAKMHRTSSRAMAAGRITIENATLFGVALLAAGLSLLWFTTSIALLCAAIGFGVYVAWYTPLKHRSAHALWVGAIAGAMPVVAGYGAAAGTLDTTAFIFFALMFLWQIPHFLSIAKYRHEEYAAAGVPLFVGAPKNAKSRATARKIYYASLIVLVLVCLFLIVQR